MRHKRIGAIAACTLAAACNAEPGRVEPQEPAAPTSGREAPLSAATWRSAASKADRVAVGSVAHIASRYTTTEQGFRVIASDVTLTVDDAGAEPVVFTVLGGEINGLRLDVSHTPRFEQGGRYLVLLAQRSQGPYEITGGELGGLAIDGTDRVPALDTTVGALTAQLRSAP